MESCQRSKQTPAETGGGPAIRAKMVRTFVSLGSSWVEFGAGASRGALKNALKLVMWLPRDRADDVDGQQSYWWQSMSRSTRAACGGVLGESGRRRRRGWMCTISMTPITLAIHFSCGRGSGPLVLLLLPVVRV